MKGTRESVRERERQREKEREIENPLEKHINVTSCLLATAVYLERRARHAEKEFLINDQAQW